MQGFQHSHGNGLSQGAVLSAGTTTDQGSPAPVDLQYVKETKKNPKQGDIFCTVKTHTLGWLWDVGSPAFRPPRKGIFYTSVCSSEDFTPQWLIKVTRDHKGGALIQQDKCFYKKRKRQEGQTEIKGWVRAKPDSAVRKLRDRRRNQTCQHLSLETTTSRTVRNRFLQFKLLSLWCCVMAAQANKYTREQEFDQPSIFLLCVAF